MWITVNARARVWDADEFEHVDGVLVSLRFGVTEMKLRDLHQLFRDAHEWVERSHRVLKDHADALAANLAHVVVRERHDVLPVKEHLARYDPTGRARDETYDRKIGHGLP